jgi:ABC-type dipeptide/oligopeptide/nickel transport system permease component
MIRLGGLIASTHSIPCDSRRLSGAGHLRHAGVVTVIRYLLLRLMDAIPTVLLVLTLVFVAMRILPGDPAVAALGDYATPEQLNAFRERMGLNVPLWQQYLNFVLGVLQLDFGMSMATNQSVATMIADSLPYTIELTITAVVIGVAIGVPFGVWAATNRNKAPDSAMRGFSMLGYAIPDFYLGALLLIVFALQLKWFPISGSGSGFVDRLYHVFLPALTLGLVKAAFIGRLTRTSLLEVLGRDFVRTARAKGAREGRVTYRHALRNALLPLTTGLGLSVLATLSGSVAIELVFNRPGIGKLLINAIAERDYGVIQGGVVVFAMFVVLINLLMDLVYILVDPRIRINRNERHH